MMSLETIRYYERKAARDSQKRGVVPYHPETIEDISLDDPRFGIPNLGCRTPRGWRKTNVEFFVDKGGWGAEGEPALTLRQFIQALRDHFATHPTAGYAMTSEGQFQCYVTAFEKIAV